MTCWLLLPPAAAALVRYWSADPSYARKFPLFISIDGDDQRTLLLASALHQASGVQIITRRYDRVQEYVGIEVSVDGWMGHVVLGTAGGGGGGDGGDVLAYRMHVQ